MAGGGVVVFELLWVICTSVAGVGRDFKKLREMEGFEGEEG